MPLNFFLSYKLFFFRSIEKSSIIRRRSPRVCFNKISAFRDGYVIRRKRRSRRALKFGNRFVQIRLRL
jgi:hypothetical protein